MSDDEPRNTPSGVEAMLGSFLDKAEGGDGDAEEAMALSEEPEPEVAEALQTVLRPLLRELRARRGVSTLASSGVEDLYTGLAGLTSRHGEIHLRVGVDGLYFHKARVLEISPHDDRALFRVFQHGVRQLSFSPGLTLAEVEGLITVLTTDPEAMEEVEDDISTLLVDMELEAIHFVVVDTFSESGMAGAEAQQKAADLAELMAAALQETISGNPDMAAQISGGSVRFMSADVTFLEEADLGALVAELPADQGDGAVADGAQGGSSIRAELVAGLDRWTPWLPGAVLPALEGADDRSRLALCRMLGGQLLTEARKLPLAQLEPQLSEIGQWLDANGEAPSAPVVAGNVFSARLAAVALAVLHGDDEPSRPAALEVLQRLAPSVAGRVLVEITELPPGPERLAAIDALMAGTRPSLEQISESIGSVQSDVALALLRHAGGWPVDDEVIGLYRTAFSHANPVLRALVLQWFVLHGGARSTPVFAEALRDRDSQLRGVALHLLLEHEPAYAVDLVKAWFGGPAFKRLPMEEKRIGARALVALAGDSVLESARRLVRKMNLTGDQRLDEMRAAATVVLGMLGDKRSDKRIAKLAKSRLCGPALQEEAKRVMGALQRGVPVYPTPRKELRKVAIALGVVQPADDDDERRSLAVLPGGSLDSIPPRAGPALVGAARDLDADDSEGATVATVVRPLEPAIPDGPDDDEGATVAAVVRPLEPAIPDETRAGPSGELVALLLRAYSFDDLPSTGPALRKSPVSDE